MYAFIVSNKNIFPSGLQCAVLGVSRSAYFSWCSAKSHRPKESAKKMEQKIIDTFQEHKGRYGSRRICKAMEAKGETVSRYKAGKVLHKFGLKAIQPRSFVPKTTDSRHPYAISPNLLLDRDLPQQPNEVWVGDITYIALAGLPGHMDGFVFPKNHWLATAGSHAGSTDNRGIKKIAQQQGNR